MSTVFVESAEVLMKELFLASRERLQQDISAFMLREGSGRRLHKLKAIPSGALWNFVESRYSGGYMSSAVMAAPSIFDGADTLRLQAICTESPTDKESVLSPLQALSAQVMPSRSLATTQWSALSLTSLCDIDLALETESALPSIIRKEPANFGWGLLTALSSILQKIPGHMRCYSCFKDHRTSCPANSQLVNSCISILSEVAEHVGKTWAFGYGMDSLQTQCVFVRFDALASVALSIVGSIEYGCLPSIDANLCEIADERDNGSRDAEHTAFMGFPREMNLEDEYGAYRQTRWRGVLEHAAVKHLVYPEQRIEAETASRPLYSGKRRPGKIISVDFLHLSSFDLPAPQIDKAVLRYRLEIPGFAGRRFTDRDGEVNFQVGDVFWLSMISVGRADKYGFIAGPQGYSGAHLGVMMNPASTIVQREEGQYARQDAIQKEQEAAILFLPRDNNGPEQKGFNGLLERMMGSMGRNRLVPIPARPGDQVIRLIPTGINIESELTAFRVTFQLQHYIPKSVNLASVHPRLLQTHTQDVLVRLHHWSSTPDRKKGVVPTASYAKVQEEGQKEIGSVIEAIYPRFKPEQLRAVSLPLLWARLMQSSFFDAAGNAEHDVRGLFSTRHDARDMKYIGAHAFFIRGPPGTGKSYVITSLITAALFGHKSEEDVNKVLPKSIKRIMVITHTNAAVDDILTKVEKSKQFKEGELVRVGVRGKNAKYTTSQVFERRIRKDQRKDQSERRNNRSRNRGENREARSYPPFTESDIIDEALVVFSTFGSLQRTEFGKAMKPFGMVIIEEAGKLHEGDLLRGLAQVTGMKTSPEPGSPLPIVLVGDEMQLPPHSNLDPNLTAPYLCPVPLIERYVSKCENIPGSFDFNYPVTLLTQHRAHRAIANIHSHFAYKGVIQTGARGSWEKWNADGMEKHIGDSLFKLRTVSVVSYRGTVHSDMRGGNRLAGNTNELEYKLICNVCKDWCYRSKKFDNRITILSPYKAQVERIKNLLAGQSKRQGFHGLATIEVYTVDSSQGLENDIVILSLVRTHRSQRQAFLDNPYPISVMLSRARERLVVLGARDEVSAISSNWKRLYSIIDALARAERLREQDDDVEEQHGVDGEAIVEEGSKSLHYGFYDAVSENAISGPKDIPPS